MDEPATEWEVLQRATADAMASDSGSDGSSAGAAGLLARARRKYESERRRRRPNLPGWGSSESGPGPDSE